ncbi:PfkB family carbohydrate kinase [Shewanella sp. NIFS-20-20]|uniref:PfkB family carbohydrate kinase n=1 Tax=Shewanella sp. NIFS-20-20 TaxID=2853806 RepID=UPI001C45EDD6|nr:PfkB family carbohydrate kinase [Shewanella sp. NIFS-20-20]MBV7316078.1 ribokinase [Shewanella sp. NIFS-20-20]
MARIMLSANLNCDRLLILDKSLTVGGRYHYQDGGKRIGGGGANTGIGLLWAGHQVSLATQVGNDAIGDWLVAQISTLGMDCHSITRYQANTCEMLLMITPDKERTIVRPMRPVFQLPAPPDWQDYDALYINSSAQGAASWAKTALPHCVVVAQLAKDDRERPCHVLITSASDLAGRSALPPWEFAKQIAGDSLTAFIVTEGVDGACVYRQDSVQRVAAIVSEVVDTTGAGDGYAAGLIHGLVNGQNIEQAMHEAARWGALAVSTAASVPGQPLANYLNHSLC